MDSATCSSMMTRYVGKVGYRVDDQCISLLESKGSEVAVEFHGRDGTLKSVWWNRKRQWAASGQTTVEAIVSCIP